MFEKLKGRTPSYIDSEECVKFAVAAPFLPDTKELLFEVRAQELKRQPGEICFPGGRIESGETPDMAALRETSEELLLPAANINIVAPLDILPTFNQSLIYPYVATLRDYKFTFNHSEVAEVFTVPFDFFLHNEPKIMYNTIGTFPENAAEMNALLGTDNYPWAKGRSKVLFYMYKNRLIWGMTAKFTYNLVKLYRET